jgi:hypothetical protein
MKIVKDLKFIFLVFFFIFNINLSFADYDSTIQNQAELCLNNSRTILNELIENNFSYQRVEDSLNNAQNIYDSQVILLQSGKSVDFSLIIPYCDEIFKIRNFAFDAIDQYSSLKKFYNVSITSDMNSSSINAIFYEIWEEIDSERYEKVPELVDKAYEEISKVKSSHTALNIFYDATTRSFKKFLEKNGLFILIIVFLLLLFFLVFNKKISKRIIENKINHLELRRKTLQDLIKKTQMDYFQNGTISEGNFNLRTKKFAEFIRDIDRQIPLLKEELAKINRQRKR